MGPWDAMPPRTADLPVITLHSHVYCLLFIKKVADAFVCSARAYVLDRMSSVPF